MRTHSRIQYVGVFTAVACAALSQVAAAQEASAPVVYLRLGVHQAGFSADVLNAAEAQVTLIYRHAGITIAWIGDRANDAAMAQRIPGRVVDVLVRSNAAAVGLNRPDSAVGMAPGSASGRGTAAFIFSSGVEHTALKCQAPQVCLAPVLAIAIAHEVGHLLLPVGHSNAGLMRANWDVLDLALACRGLLLFNARQGDLMRVRLQQQQER